MNILGLNYFYHDSTACIVSDGKLIAAIEEERLTRRKHTTEFPKLAAKRCLDMAGLDFTDVDAVAVSIKPTLNMQDKLLYGLKHAKEAKPFLAQEVQGTRARQKSLKSWHETTWPDKSRRPRIHFVPHHLSHSAGSFLVSPYETAALLGLDGAGEWATSFLGKGEGREIECYNQSFFPHSLGSFYEAVTEYCGFRSNYDEGKTMGLAPLGDPDVFYKPVSEMVRVDDDGSIHIDLSYFSYQYWGYRRCAQKFIDTFGPARKHGEPFEDRHQNVAAAFQRVLEDRALQMCRILHKKTRCKHIVVAGGVALNSVMNGRIVRESGFDDLYVMPAAGDNGTAIGAAFYVYNVEKGFPRNFVHDDPYVGTRYSNDEIRKTLLECKLNFERHDNIEAVAAEELRKGSILGWFQGRMEIGPRALGNRSILADPTLPGMKDKINAEVKHREAYRPFAPSVVVEAKDKYFESKVEAPFMLKVCDVVESAREVIPAITHVDGSARLQTVRKELNPRYHTLISEFGKRSGVPVVLNTSFNVQGEPIVESPFHAIRCFFSTGLDVLVLGNYLVRK